MVPGAGTGTPNGGEQLVRLERGLVEPLEELADRKGARVGPTHLDLGSESEEGAGRVARVVGLREHASDGRDRADAHVAHDREDVGEGGDRLPDDRARGDAVMRGERLDPDRRAVAADLSKLPHPVEKDEHLRIDQALPEHDRHRGRAGHDLRVVTVLAEHRHGLLHGLRLGGSGVQGHLNAPVYNRLRSVRKASPGDSGEASCRRRRARRRPCRHPASRPGRAP